MNRILLMASIVLFCGLFVGLGVVGANDGAELIALEWVDGDERVVISAETTTIPNLLREQRRSAQAQTPIADEQNSTSGATTERSPNASLVGINGAGCKYPTIVDAMLQTTPGDTLFIEHGTYNELLREIPISLTFVPALPGSSCKLEDTGADSNDVIISGSNGSDDGTGGLVEITSGATVTFRHMWLRDATSTNGGIIAVTGASQLILDDVLVTDGNASAAGGNIYVAGSGNDQSIVELINDTSVYRGTTLLGDGGAIALFNSKLIAKNSNIGVSSNNGFSTAGNNGGGIYAVDSAISFSGAASDIIWNEAGNYGGGIFADSSEITFEDGNVSFNETLISGGGIYQTGGGSLTVRDAKMEENATTMQATNEGGGAVYVESGSARFDNAELLSNVSSNSGGGVTGYRNTEVEVTNGTLISGNVSSSGGGLNIWGTLMVEGSQVVHNDVSSIGGGIFCFVCRTIHIREASSINLNQASYGGGIRIIGDPNSDATLLRVEDSTIANNVAQRSDEEGKGGGVYLANATMIMTDTALLNNSTDLSGGGLYASTTLANPTIVTLTNSALSNNETTVQGTNEGGGGIYANDGARLFLETVTLFGNETENIGGGAYVRSGSDSVIRNSTFDQNMSDASGGGLYLALGEHLIEGTAFSGNQSGHSGGGLSVVQAELTLHDSEFFGNSARWGGGVHIWLTDAQLENNKLHFNQASENGGGMYVLGADISVTTNTATCQPWTLPANSYCSEFRGNSAEIGGAIHVVAANLSNPAKLTIEHTAILQNVASEKSSALELVGTYSSTVGITNTLIADNGVSGHLTTTVQNSGNGSLSLHSSTLAGNFGSPLWIDTEDATTTVQNSILYLNAAGPFIKIFSDLSSSCNNSQAELSGSLGTSPGNPSFDGSHPRGDYRLMPSSASVDVCNSGVDVDTDFGVRATGIRYDQGAFELDAVPTAVGLSEQMTRTGGPVRWASTVLGLVLLGMTCIVLRSPANHRLYRAPERLPMK